MTQSVPGRGGHDLEHLADEVLGHILVEEVAHGIYEDVARLFQVQRIVEHVGMTGHREAVAVVGLAHGLQPRGHALRVAVAAAGAGLGASGDRIPCGVGPFDARLRHGGRPPG